jgi:hypothetical protein
MEDEEWPPLLTQEQMVIVQQGGGIPLEFSVCVNTRALTPQKATKMEDDAELFETKRVLFQHMYESDEHGFVRHLCFCLLTRHHPILRRSEMQREAVKNSIRMLRIKRALDRMTPDELAKYGVVAQNHSTQEGWSTRLDKYDHEVMVEGREWLRFWFSLPSY